jgi:membrane fusion protein (multidrug efflux system)
MRHRASLLALLVFLAGAAASPGCSPRSAPASASTAPPGLASHPVEPVVEVSTARVRRGSIQENVTAPASLRARRESHIGAEVSGRVQDVFVNDGDRVEPGAPLFQIDREPYQVALRQATAVLDVARAERAQIEADLERAKALQSREIMAAEQLERLRTQVAVAKARERQAGEGVALARHHLEQTLVVAPYGGSIAQRLVDEGTTALVQPQTIVVVIQETDQLEAEARIPESQLSAVRVGDPALVHVDGLAQPIQTRVSAVADTIDREARTYRVQMLVPNADRSLKAGVFARVEIRPEARREALLVPRAAVRSEDGATRVLVVRNGRVHAVPVRLGVVSEDDAEVLAGLGADAEVIVGAAAREIAPGMAVRVTSSPPACISRSCSPTAGANASRAGTSS